MRFSEVFMQALIYGFFSSHLVVEEQQCQWRGYFYSSHQLVWRLIRDTVSGTSIWHHNEGQLVVPIQWIITRHPFQQTKQRSIRFFLFDRCIEDALSLFVSFVSQTSRIAVEILQIPTVYLGHYVCGPGTHPTYYLFCQHIADRLCHLLLYSKSFSPLR
jgi:hypothetical protein